MTQVSIHAGITLAQLLPDKPLGDLAQTRVGPLRLDSRHVEPGDTFVALAGTQVDGSDYIKAAMLQGATLILSEGDVFEVSQGGVAGTVPNVCIPRLRQQLSHMASRWFGEPSKSLTVVGITGTNGKTTCSVWLSQVLDYLQSRAATIGTLGYGLAGEDAVSTGMTTPDAIAMQRILAELEDAGAQTVVAEVSSHSLEQTRVAGVNFDVAVLTNIGRDHLDYHGDMAAYVSSKTKLMAFESLQAAVINLDEKYSEQFCRAVSPSVRQVTYSVKSTQQDVDFGVTDVSYHAVGIDVTLLSPVGAVPLQLSVLGAFNLSNVLAVVASAWALGYKVEDIVGALAVIKPVSGRLEKVEVGVESDIAVLVDFAHTPDALESVLTALRQHTRAHLWCVFGCGGDRDRGKRPLMAQVCEALADTVIVTTDNPRGETPADIIGDIMVGFTDVSAVQCIKDREAAIRFAIEQAASGDCVLLAGKGHEDYQLSGVERLPFSDSAVARLAMQARLESQARLELRGDKCD